MRRHASAIAAAELRVIQSRHELRDALRRLQHRSPPPYLLAAAVVAGALVGLLLTRRVRTGALAATLATALLRRALKHRSS